jgi:hypothetical protein
VEHVPAGQSHEQPHEARDPKHAAAPQTKEPARLTSRLSWSDMPGTVREHFSLLLLDTLAVTAAGSRTEGRAKAGHRPFTPRTPRAVLTGPLGDEALVRQLRRAADRLPETDDVGPLPRDLAPLTTAPAASSGGIA